MDNRFIERGNKMWEGSRIMLTEHVEALRERKRRLKEDPKPSPSEEDFNMMGENASHSLNQKVPVVVTHWENGYYKNEEGIVERIDNQLLQIKINAELIKIELIKSIDII